jgi:hypothetical protein
MEGHLGFVAYLLGMSIAAILCWAAFAMAVFSVNPYKADFISIASFFVSLFFAIAATLTIFIFYFRGRNEDEESLTGKLGLSFRHSALIALAGVGLLIFQAIRILTWWDGALLVIAILLLEMYFRSRAI